MSGVATAVVVGTVAGAIISSESSKSAAGTMADSADRASQVQQGMYQQGRADAGPWRDAGIAALADLKAGKSDFNRDFNMSDFQKDPGYDFRMAEGQKAIERSAAARGGLNSGATLKALDRYGEDFASNEYNNAYNRFNADRDRRFNRLSSIAGLGQTANSQVSAAGTNAANNIGQNIMGAGSAQAAAQIAGGNAINSAIGNGTNTWMQYQMMNRYAPTATASTGSSGGYSYGGTGGMTMPQLGSSAGY